MNGVMPIPPAMSIPARAGSLCNPAEVANQAPCFGHRCRFLPSLAEQLDHVGIVHRPVERIEPQMEVGQDVDLQRMGLFAVNGLAALALSRRSFDIDCRQRVLYTSQRDIL